MSEPQENNKQNKFTKREWVHLLITLSVIQAFIWWVSFQFAGNSSALGYVSFAGTLISIILAVLAIGYTYGESQQQKNSSSTLANQLDSLVKIKDKLEVQASALEGIKGLEDNFAKLSNLVDSRFIETQQQVNNVNQAVNYLTSNVFMQKPLQYDLSYLFNNVKSFDNFYQQLNFCLIAVFFEREFKKSSHYTFEEFNQILNELNFDYVSLSTTRDMLFGSCTATCNMLAFLGTFNYQSHYIDPLLKDLFISSANRLKNTTFMGTNHTVINELISRVEIIDFSKL